MDFKTLSDFTGLTEGYASSQGSSLDTGDLRRGYGFLPIPDATQVGPANSPLLAIVSKMRKRPTDDPQPKTLERRSSVHRRYAYVVAHGTSVSGYSTTDATVTYTNVDAGDTYWVRMAADYKSAGNIGIVYDAEGNSRSAFQIGASGTRPEFFLVGQVVKIPCIASAGAATNTDAAAFATIDHFTGRIEQIILNTNTVDLKLTIVDPLTANRDLAGWGSANNTADYPMSSLSAANLVKLRVFDQLERARSYVIMTAFARGSGYPNSWSDNPFSTGYTNTQIFKTVLAMDETTRATVLKIEPNEFNRLYRDKVIEHNVDIDNGLLWSALGTGTDSMGKTIYYTQGIADYAINYGLIFTLASTANADDFLDNMATFMDTRLKAENEKATIWFADKWTLNWLVKISGFALQNLKAATDSTYSAMSMDYKGYRDIKLGDGSITSHEIWTPYGSMNLVYCPQFDGTGVSILAANLNDIEYRPLVGNGINRDTRYIPGVQTLETTGIDGRVDLIQTEVALTCKSPEHHAVWKRA
jgi:hypothetical protein